MAVVEVVVAVVIEVVAAAVVSVGDASVLVETRVCVGCFAVSRTKPGDRRKSRRAFAEFPLVCG